MNIQPLAAVDCFRPCEINLAFATNRGVQPRALRKSVSSDSATDAGVLHRASGLDRAAKSYAILSAAAESELAAFLFAVDLDYGGMAKNAGQYWIEALEHTVLTGSPAADLRRVTVAASSRLAREIGSRDSER